MKVLTHREVDALIARAWKHFDVKFEERSRLRRQEAALRCNPLHNAHVQAFWAQRPSGVRKEIRQCQACGGHKPVWLWPRVEGGRKIAKHCGCAKVRAIDTGTGAGRAEQNRSKILDSKRAWRARRAAALGKPYRPYAALCEAHVRCWAKVVERLHVLAIAEDRARFSAHSGHVSAWKASRPADAYRHRYRTDPAFNAAQKVRARLRKISVLDGRMAAHFALYVKQGSLAAAWREFLGYSYDQLVDHLRRTIPKRYRWDDFIAGRLHIDHVVPRFDFDLTDPDEVRRCWALSNLRLLPATANLRKRARREYLL